MSRDRRHSVVNLHNVISKDSSNSTALDIRRRLSIASSQITDQNKLIFDSSEKFTPSHQSVTKSKPKTTDSETKWVFNEPQTNIAAVHRKSQQSIVIRWRHWEFILSCLAYTVGQSNLWRFPVQVLNNGGIAYFIPYIIIMAVVGLPIYLMEMAVGQYSGKGPISIWSLNPCAKGVGISMLISSVFLCLYGSSMLSYSVFYVYSTFIRPLPWTFCREEWVQDNCYASFGKGFSLDICDWTLQNTTSYPCKCKGKFEVDFYQTHECYTKPVRKEYIHYVITSSLPECRGLQRCTNKTRSPGSFYFVDEVLKRSKRISDLGSPRINLLICLAITWGFILIGILKGIKFTGKVALLTVPFPTLLLIVLLVGGNSMPNAWKGIKYFLKPNWFQLIYLKTWFKAAQQVVISLGCSFGPIITLSSYNEFRTNFYTDTLIIGFVDCVVSIVGTCVLFSTVGTTALEFGKDMDNLAAEGANIIFIEYTEGLSRLPYANLMSVTFYLCLFLYGIGTQIGLLLTIITCIINISSKLLRYRIPITITVAAMLFGLGVPMTCNSGQWIITLLEHYTIGYPMFLIAFFEIISVMWIYGSRQFVEDMIYMLGFLPQPSGFWMFCWTMAAPLTTMCIFLMAVIKLKPPVYPDGVEYEQWAQYIGIGLSALMLLPIPLVFFIKFFRCKKKTFKKKLQKITKPKKTWIPQPHVKLQQFL